MDYNLANKVKTLGATTPTLRRPQSAHASVNTAPVQLPAEVKETVGASSPTKNVSKKFTPKTYSDNEIKKLLDEYVEIPKASWESLKVNDHIRYFSKDKKFRRGGFIKNIYQRNGKNFFLIGTMIDNRKDQGGITFPVAFEDISKLYKKGKLTADLSQDKRIAELEKLTSELEKRIKILEKKI